MTPPFHTHETLPVVYMLIHGITVNQLSQKITLIYIYHDLAWHYFSSDDKIYWDVNVILLFLSSY